MLPFNTRTKDDKSEAKRVNRNYKYKKPKDIDKIREEVKKLKRMREEARHDDWRGKDKAYKKQRTVLN